MNFELIDKIQDIITLIAIPIYTFTMCYILYLLIKINKKLKNVN